MRYALNRIREIRRAKNMTLEQLSSQMYPEVTLGTVQKLETGGMALTLDYINEIARVLNVEPYQIISDTPGVKIVPVIDADQLSNWQDAIAGTGEFSPVPMTSGGDNMFAVRQQPGFMDRIAPPGGLAVIDPDQFDLENGKVFACKMGDGSVGIYRFLSNPPRLEPCSSNDGIDSIPLGRKAFTVEGRVTYSLSPI